LREEEKPPQVHKSNGWPSNNLPEFPVRAGAATLAQYDIGAPIVRKYQADRPGRSIFHTRREELAAYLANRLRDDMAMICQFWHTELTGYLNVTGQPAKSRQSAPKITLIDGPK